ncbi:MAG: hypothetical protein AABY16_02175 [Nanoarchaeota archaeon]
MRILFLCSSNIFRSQMAESFFNKLAKKHKAQSAALIKTQDKMHRLVVRAMSEINIDITKNKSKKVTEDMLKEADIVVLMSKDLNQLLDKSKLKKGAKVEYWNIPDVIAAETDEQKYHEFLKAREIIKEKVKTLINSL